MGDLISKDHLIQFLKEELDSNQVIFEKLLGHFTKHLSDLRLSKNDLTAQASLAHKAKPGCLSFGATSLYYKLEELESLAKTNNFEGLNKLFASIETQLDPTLHEIRKIALDYFKGAA